MKAKSTVLSIALTFAVALSGCATQTASEANFGKAVRDVTRHQTYDLGATLYSEPEPVIGADPYQLENTINTHRDGSSQSQQVESPVQVGVGTGNRQ